MDTQRLDAVVRRLPVSMPRRGFFRIGTYSLAASVLTRFGLSSSAVFGAKSGRCKTPCGECELCDRGTCRKRKNGEKRCKPGACRPRANSTSCSFGGVCFEGACQPT